MIKIFIVTDDKFNAFFINFIFMDKTKRFNSLNISIA